MKIVQVSILLALIFGSGVDCFAGVPEIGEANELIAQLEPIKETTLPSYLREELERFIAQRDLVLKFEKDGDKRLPGAIKILKQKLVLLSDKTSKYIQEYREKSEKIDLSLKCDYRPRIPPIEMRFDKEDQRMIEQMLIPLLNEHWFPALERAIPDAFSKYFPFLYDDEAEKKPKTSALDHAAEKIREKAPRWLIEGRGALSEKDMGTVIGFLAPEVTDESKMPDGVQINVSGLRGKFKHGEGSRPSFKFSPDPVNPGGLLIRVVMPSVSVVAQGNLDATLMDDEGGNVVPMEGLERVDNGNGRFLATTRELLVTLLFATRTPVIGQGAVDLLNIEVGEEGKVPDYSLELFNLPAFNFKIDINEKSTVINLADEGVSEKIKYLINEGWKDIIRPEINNNISQFADTYLKPIIDELLNRMFHQEIPVKGSWPTAKAISPSKGRPVSGPFFIPYSKPTLLETGSGEVFSLEQTSIRVVENSDVGDIIRLGSKIVREQGGAQGPDKKVGAGKKGIGDTPQVVNINDVISRSISIQEKTCFVVTEDSAEPASNHLVCSLSFQVGIRKEDSGDGMDTVLLPDATIPASLIRRDGSKEEGTLLYFPVRLANVTLEEAWLGRLEPQWKREGVRRLYDALLNNKPCRLDDMPQFNEWLWGTDRHIAIIANNLCSGTTQSIKEGQRVRLIRALFTELSPYRLVPTDFTIGDHSVVRVMSAPHISVTNSDDSKSIDVTIRGYMSEVTSGSLIYGDLVDVSLAARLTPTEKGVMLTYINQSGEVDIYKPLLNFFLLGQLDAILSGVIDRRLTGAIGEGAE